VDQRLCNLSTIDVSVVLWTFVFVYLDDILQGDSIYRPPSISFLIYTLSKEPNQGTLSKMVLMAFTILPNIALQHKPGTVNQAADALSHAPVGRRMLHVEMEVVGSMMQKVWDNY